MTLGPSRTGNRRQLARPPADSPFPSLRRLGTDWIDLYQMHRPDPQTLDRIDEIVRPGVNLNPADTSYGEQVLQPALRRR
jgi:hypothetical protein